MYVWGVLPSVLVESSTFPILTMSFKSRRIVDCPSCGAGEDEFEECNGRNICTSCGVILPGGSYISDRVAFSEHDNYKPMPRPTLSDSCPLVGILREKHPGCLNTAVAIVNAAEKPLTKGLHSAEYPQLAQALAYISFRADKQRVDICDLAHQVRVPIERLRKDINRLSDRLGMASVSHVDQNTKEDVDDVDASGDVSAFKQEVIAVLRPWNLASASQVRSINCWCSALFQAALRAGDVEVINAPSKYSAKAALSLYCQTEDNVFGVTKKRKRGGDDDDVPHCFMASLTKHASSRKVAMGLRRHINGVVTKKT